MRLLIIDDHPMTCAGLQSLLQSHYPDAEISLLHDLAALRDEHRDYIFLDMHLPGWAFSDVLDRLAGQLTRVILISASPEAEAVALARARGARGLLPKHIDINLLLDGFRRIQDGEPVFLDGHGLSLPAAVHLTGRQREIHQALLAGLSNKQIARKLSISEYTVKEHVTATLAAFGVRSRLELVLLQQRGPVV